MTKNRDKNSRFPEHHWVASSMIYAFHPTTFSSIGCVKFLAIYLTLNCQVSVGHCRETGWFKPLRMCLPKERPMILDQNMKFCDLKAFTPVVTEMHFFDLKDHYVFTIYQSFNWWQLVSFASNLKKSRTLQLL